MEETQLITKTSIPVMEHFYTIQGEGHHSGRAAYFIRLAGCDVGCHWCDVKESWEVHPSQLVDFEVLGQKARESGCQTIVITGGEPLMHNLEGLCSYLKGHGFMLHLETSAAHPLSGKWDWITFSPKKFKAPRRETAALAHELKVVINHPSDFDFAEQHAKGVSEDCLLYLQPEWSKRERMMDLIVEYIKANPQWRVSLQTHKYLNIP